jgi:hypothetical protein
MYNISSLSPRSSCSIHRSQEGAALSLRAPNNACAPREAYFVRFRFIRILKGKNVHRNNSVRILWLQLALNGCRIQTARARDPHENSRARAYFFP